MIIMMNKEKLSPPLNKKMNKMANTIKLNFYRRVGLISLAGLLTIVIPAMAWIVIFFTVSSKVQDFPLNDDWAYALGALQFSRGKGVEYFHWSAVPMLGMWVWATPFVWSLGPSNVALRISGIVSSWVGLAAYRDLLRQNEVGPWMATFGTLLLAFNPLFFMMSGTFMTDVPTLAMSLLALTCYNRGFEGVHRPGFLLTACLAATMAAVTRQSALGLSLAVAASLLQRQQMRLRPSAWIATILPGLVCLLTAAWFAGRPDVVVFKPTWPSWERIFNLTIPLVITIGLFCMPAAIFTYKKSLVFWCLFGLVASGGIAWAGFRRILLGRTLLEGGLIPYIGNVLTPYGSFGTGLILGDRTVVLDTGWRFGLSMLGCFGAAVLLIRLGAFRRSGAIQQILLWYAFFQIPFLIISNTFFDRYILVFIPTAIFIMIHNSFINRRKVVLGLTGLVIFIASSMAFTHDWLAWNAARWELGRRAVASGIPASEIEGGFEWDNWFDPHPNISISHVTPDKSLTIPFNLLRHSHLIGRYGLSFSPLPGTRVIDQQSYTSWLIRRPLAFYLIEKQNITEPSRASSRWVRKWSESPSQAGQFNHPRP